MPYNRTYRRRFRYARRYRKRTTHPSGFATRPRMMPKSLARKRFNQVSTKVFWFKDNGQIQNNIGGFYQRNFVTQDIISPIPQGFASVTNLYDEYKVLAMKIKFFPANVGIEPDSSLFASAGLLRGDAIVWSDQRPDNNPPATISSISDKINQASCRMLNPRRPYTRTIYRSTGNPDWAGTAVLSNTPDSWNGVISIFGQNTTPVNPPAAPITLWYWTRQYKVLCRGRINP